ncbi:MAG: hypothetical protein GY714_01785 [Desulfobacterales bacterium]|nr:hypothetical protein [Desulfobacterales bacterium]
MKTKMVNLDKFYQESLNFNDWLVSEGFAIEGEIGFQKAKILLKGFRNMPTNDEFSNIEIDVSQELLDSLTITVDNFLLENLKPCSYTIWEEERDCVIDILTLSQLFGECLINDLIVEILEMGLGIIKEKEVL